MLEKTIGFLDKGGMLLVDNAPNMVASTVNPALGMTVMFANEKNSSYDSLIGAGVNEEIANTASSRSLSSPAMISHHTSSSDHPRPWRGRTCHRSVERFAGATPRQSHSRR